jgi:hypothetical protein
MLELCIVIILVLLAIAARAIVRTFGNSILALAELAGRARRERHASDSQEPRNRW